MSILIPVLLSGLGLGLILKKEDIMTGDPLTDFYIKYKDTFLKVAIKYGYDHLILMAHAFYESFSPKRGGLSKLSEDYNNFFGIKGKENAPDSVYLYTKERNPDGSIKTIKAPFKIFESVEHCLEHYINVIQNNFPQAYNNRSNPVKYFNGLFPDTGKKYATANKNSYISSCLKIYQRLSEVAKKYA